MLPLKVACVLVIPVVLLVTTVGMLIAGEVRIFALSMLTAESWWVLGLLAAKIACTRWSRLGVNPVNTLLTCHPHQLPVEVLILYLVDQPAGAVVALTVMLLLVMAVAKRWVGGFVVCRLADVQILALAGLSPELAWVLGLLAANLACTTWAVLAGSQEKILLFCQPPQKLLVAGRILYWVVQQMQIEIIFFTILQSCDKIIISVK